MTWFINYRPEIGISINTWRVPGGYCNDDILGLVDDIRDGCAGCCPLAGAPDALKDGSLWADGMEDILEALHYAVTPWEAEAAAL